jgi:hypothetical protein
MNDISSLFKKRINWRVMQTGKAEWYADIDGERGELRMNNFPDEPLYTLTYKGNTVDFDDKPMIWIVPLNE